MGHPATSAAARLRLRLLLPAAARTTASAAASAASAASAPPPLLAVPGANVRSLTPCRPFLGSSIGPPVAAFASSSSSLPSSASSFVPRGGASPSAASGVAAAAAPRPSPQIRRAISSVPTRKPTMRAYASSSASSSSAPPSGEEILSYLSSSSAGKNKEKEKEFVGTDVPGAMAALARADAVCFDVDSTVIDEEGIDVLAASLGKGDEVAAWTLKAMEGDTKFEDALAARLAIIQPSKSDIERCLRDTPLRLSPGVDRLIEALNERGTDVYLISGGFRIMIEPVARQVCVGRANIVANTILFDNDGNYAGFDPDEPTSADMGKPKAVGRIKDEHGYRCVVMVGDGATDMQAKPPADSFIGYGGVAVREAVRDGACWFVTDFEDMIAIVRRFGESKLE